PVPHVPFRSTGAAPRPYGAGFRPRPYCPVPHPLSVTGFPDWPRTRSPILGGAVDNKRPGDTVATGFGRFQWASCADPLPIFWKAPLFGACPVGSLPGRGSPNAYAPPCRHAAVESVL